MTKTDFAELKEKLCRKIYVDIYVQREHDTAIITELLEIIQSQSEALEHACNYLKDTGVLKIEDCEPDKQMYFSFIKALSETTTRLQKLMDGKNGNTTN